MTTNQKIVAATAAALSLEFPLFDERSGRCQQVVRELLEHAFGWPEGEYYRRFRTHVVEENGTGKPWARDMQLSLREAGLQVPRGDRQPGDLIHTHLFDEAGHVGVLHSRYHFIENTASSRGVLISGCNRLTHINEWRVPEAHVEFFRLPEGL